MRWTPREDTRLRAVMEQRGDDAVCWRRVADMIGNRNAKQCRERWMQHLRPSTQAKWSQNEDLQIICGVHRYGHRWSTIAQTLRGRSDNNVKNRAHRLKLVTQSRDAWAVESRASTPDPAPSPATTVDLFCHEQVDSTWWEEPTLPHIQAPDENLPNLFFFDENGLIAVSD